MQSLPGGDWNRFTGRTAGCFDYRARIVSDFLAQQIAYRFRGNEAWLFPEETLLLRAGDCEDRALLTAALLLQCGISSFNLRVAIGKVRLGSRQAFDHAWVAYKTEIGTWTVIDPPAAVVQQAPRGRKRAPPSDCRATSHIFYSTTITCGACGTAKRLRDCPTMSHASGKG